MFGERDLASRQRALLDRVRVNAPALMLRDGLIDKFLAWRIHPEVGLDSRALDEMSRGQFEEMAGCFKEAGLKTTVHGPFFDLSPGALDRRILEVTRDRFHQALDTAVLFAPEHMVFHANYDDRQRWAYREEWLRISLETWRPLAGRAGELGIRLVLENTHEECPEEIEPLLAALASEGVGFCFDAGHASAFGRAGLLDWLEVLGPYLSALHLHDNHGDRDEHLAIGQGSIDFRSLFLRLADRGLRPKVVTLEPHQESQLWPGLETLADLWPWGL